MYLLVESFELEEIIKREITENEIFSHANPVLENHVQQI